MESKMVIMMTMMVIMIIMIRPVEKCDGKYNLKIIKCSPNCLSNDNCTMCRKSPISNLLISDFWQMSLWQTLSNQNHHSARISVSIVFKIRSLPTLQVHKHGKGGPWELPPNVNWPPVKRGWFGGGKRFGEEEIIETICWNAFIQLPPSRRAHHLHCCPPKDRQTAISEILAQQRHFLKSFPIIPWSDFHWEDKEMMMPQALILSWKPMSWIQNSQTTLCVKLGNLTLSWKEGEFCRYFSILDNWGRNGTPGVGERKQQCRLQRCSLKSRWWMILCEYFRRICVGKCKWWPMRQILSVEAFSGWKGWTKANRFFKKRKNVEKYFLVKLHGNRFICLTRLVGWLTKVNS